MSGYVACLPTAGEKKRKDPPDDSKVTNLLDFDYPYARVDRVNHFTRVDWVDHLKSTSISSDYAMKRNCGRHDHDNMFHIGTNTLDG